MCVSICTNGVCVYIHMHARVHTHSAVYRSCRSWGQPWESLENRLLLRLFCVTLISNQTHTHAHTSHWLTSALYLFSFIILAGDELH